MSRSRHLDETPARLMCPGPDRAGFKLQRGMRTNEQRAFAAENPATTDGTPTNSYPTGVLERAETDEAGRRF